VTGVVGAHLFDLTDDFKDSGVDIQEKINFGARYQYNFTPRWGVEGSFLFTPSTPQVIANAVEVDMDTWYYSGNVVFNLLTEGKVIPYVTGGGGGVTLDVQNGGDRETYFGGNFGGGVAVAVVPRLSIRGDVRDYVYAVNELTIGSAEALGLPVTFDETIQDLALTFGVTLHF